MDIITPVLKTSQIDLILNFFPFCFWEHFLRQKRAKKELFNPICRPFFYYFPSWQCNSFEKKSKETEIFELQWKKNCGACEIYLLNVLTWLTLVTWWRRNFYGFCFHFLISVQKCCVCADALLFKYLKNINVTGMLHFVLSWTSMCVWSFLFTGWECLTCCLHFSLITVGNYYREAQSSLLHP